MKERFNFKVLLFLSLVFILVACGGSDDESGGAAANGDSNGHDVNVDGWPIVNEVITMSMMAPGTGIIPWEEMPVFTYLNEATHIHFTFQTPPLADFGTSLNLALASGDVADIILGAGGDHLSRAMEIEFGSAGILLPLEDLIENYAPNLSALLEAYPEIRRNITAPDGHIYSLPSIVRNTTALWPNGPLWYNGAWLEALDAEVPSTVDEFFDLMVRFRDEEPAGPGVQTFPISNGDQMRWMRQYFAAAFGMTSTPDVGIEVVDGIVRHNATTDNYRAYLEWMAMLHAEEILHPESFTMSSEAHRALVGDNQVGLFQDWFSFFSLGQTEEEALNHPMFRPLTSEFSPTPVLPAGSGITTGVFALTANNPNPAAAMRWVDYFYSPEGSAFIGQGPEGYFWEYQATDEGLYVRVFAPDVDLGDTESTRGRITPDFGIPVPILVLDHPPIRTTVNDEPDMRFRDFIDSQTQATFVAYGNVAFPPAGLTLEEADRVSVITSDLETFLTESEARFIAGLDPINDETWAAFQATLAGMNIQELIEIYQDVFDRWASN